MTSHILKFHRLLAACCIGAAVVLLGASGASSLTNRRDADAPSGRAVVIPVSGLIDPANADMILSSIRSANADRADLIVLQLDSKGATAVRPSKVVAAITNSNAPVAVWVGPSGASARGLAAELAVAAPLSGIANGAPIGPATPLRLDRPDQPNTNEVADQLAALSARNARSPESARLLARQSLGASEAVERGIIDSVQPTLGAFLVSLDGKTVQTVTGPKTLATAKVVGEGENRRTVTALQVQFRGLTLAQQVSHTLTSPSIAYLLLVTGLALIVFEFFAASIGIAGVVGAVCLLGAFVGFGHLPMNWWAVALIAFGVFGFAIDVQVGRFGVWSAVGGVAAIAGSLLLYGGSSELDPAWWVIGLVVVGLVTFMLGGMTAIVRTRFSTPTIGREALIGAMGTAEVALAPEGVVRIDGARWQARTNRATPIPAGDVIRVVSVEGFLLEVEPETGGAMDYRDRARKRRTIESEPPNN
ncbi:MAG: NfeD family protein [Acidimicrobiia bacterium]